MLFLAEDLYEDQGDQKPSQMAYYVEGQQGNNPFLFTLNPLRS